MDFTVVEPSPTDSGLSRRRSSGGTTSATSYSSKSLERPKKQKIARQSSPGSGTASVVKSLSVGKSVSSGLNQLESDPMSAYDSEENITGDYEPLSHTRLDTQSVTTDETYYSYNRLSAIPSRMRTSTSPASMMDNSRLSRNTHLAESCRMALKDHSLPIPSTHDTYAKRLQQCRSVIDEIVNTERTYVLLLNDILRGYRDPLNVKMHELPISVADAAVLFGEIMEIRNFNRGLLDSVEKCGYDLRRLGECFLHTWGREEGCDVYSKYCTKYPLAIEVYSRCMHNPIMLEFFKKCQHDIHHPLPLGSDLLEPVQRVLRYHILLAKILNNLRPEEDGYCEVKSAHETMTGVAEQINEMKRKHETTVHVQEVQSQLVGWVGNDLATYGDLIREDAFKYYAGRGVNIPFRGADERYVFLFKKLILLSKRREDTYKYKGHISWTDLQLIETLERYPNSFQVKQLSTGTIHTFHAKADSVKMGWVMAIKNMIVESIPALNKRGKTKDLLVKGAKKTDLSSENVTFDYRTSKSASMHGLDEIKPREQSPRTPTSRLANSLTTKSSRTLPKKLSTPKKSVDDSSLPSNSLPSNRHSVVSDSGSYHEEHTNGVNGIVMENTRSADFVLDHQQQHGEDGGGRHHPSLTHSRSAVLSKPHPPPGETPFRFTRNLSDSSVHEVKRSASPTDSMYSSDSVGSSLDQLDSSEGYRGGRGTSPANLDNTDQPPGSPQFQVTRTRLSGRRRKPRPTSFAESDDIPEDDILRPSASPLQVPLKTRPESADPSSRGGHHDNSNGVGGLVDAPSDPLLASLDNLGDSLLKEVIAVTDIQPSSTGTSEGGRGTATPTAAPMKTNLRRNPSNELGLELKDDLIRRYESSKARRETLEQDLQTTSFDESLNLSPPSDDSISVPQPRDSSINVPQPRDSSIFVPPPNDSISVNPPTSESHHHNDVPITLPPPSGDEGVDQTTSSTSVTSIDRYILAPPNGFQNGDQEGLSPRTSQSEDQVGLSPTTSETFFTPSASPLPTNIRGTPLDVPLCDVAPVREEGCLQPKNSSDRKISSDFDPSINADAISDDPISKRSSVALSISSVGSTDSPGRAEVTEGSTTSTPEQRHRVIPAITRHRPLSTCSADSLSSDGSPGGLRRKSPAQNNSLETSPGISQLAVVDNTASDKTDLSSVPPVSVRGEPGMTPPSSGRKPETTVSKLLAEMGITTQSKSELESDKVSLDEILPYLDHCAAVKMSTPPTNKMSTPPSKKNSPRLATKSSVPTIVIDSGSDEVKRRSKPTKKSPRMSPMRRHTTPDFAAALEAESREEMQKSKSPRTRVKKIARDYSQRLKDKGKMSRFQSFNTRPGYTALGDSPDASPQIPHWRKEIREIQDRGTLVMDDESEEESVSPSRPPWMEEAKRVRELRKTQTSPSASSYDSVESAPSKLDSKAKTRSSTREEPSYLNEAPKLVLQKKLSSPAQISSGNTTSGADRRVSCPLPPSSDQSLSSDSEKRARSRLSLSPSDYEMRQADLFHIKELSKSTENLPRSMSASEIKPTFFSPRQSRSLKSFLRASNSPSAKRSFSADVKEVLSPEQREITDFEQVSRRGGFKGFVKNIVDRFSGKNH